MNWTPDLDAELSALRTAHPDWTHSQIASAISLASDIDISEDSARNRARRLGLPSPVKAVPGAAPVSDLQTLEEAAARLHAQGIDVRVENGRVGVGIPDRDRELSIDLGKDHYRIGLVSDTHGGSKFEQLSALRAFYDYAEGEGVDFFIHSGDVTQGADQMHRGMELEVHAHGAEAQVAYVAATYPRVSVPTYAIGGNHDDSFLNNGGANVVRQIASQRPDIRYVGQDAAYLDVGALRTYVIHPDGGGTYAKSYKAQKIAEALPAERNVNLLLIGHYHQYGSFRQKNTHVLMVPCFQSQYAWLARKALSPDIGGIVADVWLDDAGRPARISHELVSFNPVENDWDRDVSHEVGLAWSSNGR